MGMLRLGSSKVIANAVRAVASQPLLSGSIAIVQRENCVSKQSFFSTFAEAKKKTDKELAKLLKSEIKWTKRVVSMIQMPEFPAGTGPFEIEDIPGEGQTIFTRELDGEKVVIDVRMPWNCEKTNLISDSSDEDEDENSSKRPANGPCAFSVKIVNENKKTWMELHCWAHMDSIRMRWIDFKGSPIIEDSTINFSQDDKDDLEEYWKKECLAVRGIDETLSRFLIDYQVKKVKRERLLFLKKFRKFVKG